MRGLLIAVCLLSASIAWAEGTDGAALVTAAKAAMDGGSPSKAANAVEAALRAGRHDQTTTARLYGMAGEVAVAQGNFRRAEDDFRRMLAIDPSARPRRSYAAEVGPVFDRVLAGVQKAGRLNVQVRAGDNGGVIVRVTSDPVGIVSGAWAEYTTGDDQQREVLLPGRGGTAFLLPGRKLGTPVTAGVVDEYGNRLAEITLLPEGGTTAKAPPTPPAKLTTPKAPERKELARKAPERKAPERKAPERKAPERKAPERKAPEPEAESEAEPAAEPALLEPSPLARAERPLYRRWPLWAGLAAGATAGAVYFALDTRRAEDEAARLAEESNGHTYDELVAIEDRGRRSALLTNVFLGSAAALAVTSAVMAFWPEGRNAAPARSSVRLQVGRASVGVAVEF